MPPTDRDGFAAPRRQSAPQESVKKAPASNVADLSKARGNRARWLLNVRRHALPPCSQGPRAIRLSGPLTRIAGAIRLGTPLAVTYCWSGSERTLGRPYTSALGWAAPQPLGRAGRVTWVNRTIFLKTYAAAATRRSNLTSGMAATRCPRIAGR